MLGKKSSLVSVMVAALVVAMISNTHAGVINDFQGYYDPGNWTESKTAPAGETNTGFVDTGGAPTSISIFGSDGAGAVFEWDVYFTIVVPTAETIQFDWNYETLDGDRDPGLDPFGYLLNGVFTQLTTDGQIQDPPYTQSGSVSITVLANQTFGFWQRSTDNSGGLAFSVISNFSGPAPLSSDPIPEPGTFVLLGLALLGVGVRRLWGRCKP